MMRRGSRRETALDFKDLTDEQREKVRTCQSPEELIALAKSEGVELTDEQLEQVAGGWEDKTYAVMCYKCGNYVKIPEPKDGSIECPYCGEWIAYRV